MGSPLVGVWGEKDARDRVGGPTSLYGGGAVARPTTLRDTRFSVHEETTGGKARGGMRGGFGPLESPD